MARPQAKISRIPVFIHHKRGNLTEKEEKEERKERESGHDLPRDTFNKKQTWKLN